MNNIIYIGVIILLSTYRHHNNILDKFLFYNDFLLQHLILWIEFFRLTNYVCVYFFFFFGLEIEIIKE